MVPVAAAVAGWVVACSPASHPAPVQPATPPPVTLGPVLRYAFSALDGSKISSDTSLGRNTVIVFITSYGGASQAQARFLDAVAHDHVPRTNCYAIITERPENRPLIEMFVDVLRLRVPVAHVDYPDLKGGPFDGVVAVPTVFILDRGGRLVWRKDALATQDEIERQLRAIE